MKTSLLAFLLLLGLSTTCLAHSIVYEDNDGHPLFRLNIPEGWSVNLDGDRISIFPQTSGAFIGTWFLEGFETEEASTVYVKTLCQAYFDEHEFSEPKTVVLDGNLPGVLLSGRARRSDSWGELRAMVFQPCEAHMCFALQFTPTEFTEAPLLHKNVIERIKK